MDERELNGEQTNGPVIENITSQLNGQQNEQVERKENLEPVAPAKEEKPQKSANILRVCSKAQGPQEVQSSALLDLTSFCVSSTAMSFV